MNALMIKCSFVMHNVFVGLTSASLLSRIEMLAVVSFNSRRFWICEISTIELLS